METNPRRRFLALLSPLLYVGMLVAMIMGIVWADVPDSSSTTTQKIIVRH